MSGIELSQPMVEQLHETRADIPVVVGDMATSTTPGQFSLVYLVWNGIGNLRTQGEQVACFRNAARHLVPGGRFVIELWVPGIRRFPPGQAAAPFHVGQHHVGFDMYDETTQQGTSHHYRRHSEGRVTYGASNFRDIWPAECDLMAQLGGWISSAVSPTGTALPSPATARVTSRSGESQAESVGRPSRRPLSGRWHECVIPL